MHYLDVISDKSTLVWDCFPVDTPFYLAQVQKGIKPVLLYSITEVFIYSETLE